ncbi:hypothetical protein O4H61_14140 [Roseovarius aestuarii]|nr:hypothetical protein [Roseovarius aestuarii]
MTVLSCHARHARLFELIRQQTRARDITQRLQLAPRLSDAALMDVARRAADSWQKLC